MGSKKGFPGLLCWKLLLLLEGFIRLGSDLSDALRQTQKPGLEILCGFLREDMFYNM
jgi:hypothetical protein